MLGPGDAVRPGAVLGPGDAVRPGARSGAGPGDAVRPGAESGAGAGAVSPVSCIPVQGPEPGSVVGSGRVAVAVASQLR